MSRRRKLLSALAIAVTATAIYLLIARAAHLSHLLSRLNRADPWWFVACVAGETLTYVAYIFLYRPIVSVRGGPRPSVRTTLRITVASFGAFVLGTSAGNLATNYWALRRMGESPSDAASRVLAINTAEWALLALLSAAASLALIAGADRRVPLELELPWVVVPALCLLAARWVSAPRRRQLSEDRGNRLRRAFAAGVRSVVILRAAFTGRPGALLVIGGVVFWGGRILTAWGALRAFGVNLGVAPLILGFATGFAANALPLPGGGIGSVDAARTFALALVGVPLAAAVLATFAARLFGFWLPLIPVALTSRGIKRLHHDLPSVPQQSHTGP